MERQKAYSKEHCDMTSDGREDKLQCELGVGGNVGWKNWNQIFELKRPIWA